MSLFEYYLHGCEIMYLIEWKSLTFSCNKIPNISPHNYSQRSDLFFLKKKIILPSNRNKAEDHLRTCFQKACQTTRSDMCSEYLEAGSLISDQ